MRVIAATQADLQVTPLGTRSRLADELAGVPVLRRSVERVCRARSVEAVYVLCPSGQRESCETILRGTAAVVRPYEADSAPWEILMQTARKWSLDGWRGGIGGATYFDEFTEAALLGRLLETVEADAVLSVPPAAPLIDPELIDRMIEHRRNVEDDIYLTFTQAPPGLAGILLDASLIRQLAEKGIPIGWLFSYKPDNPRKDLVFQPCCCDVPVDLRHAAGRLTADTERSTQRLAALLDEHAAIDLAAVGRWLTHREATCIEPLPREVEIELTTDDPYPDALLRPRGSRVRPRGPIDPAVVRQIVSEIIRYDDALVVLGGFGDPLRHPRFPDILQAIRSVRYDGRGLYGLAVRTAAADLTDQNIDAIVANEVDVVNVVVDAWSPQLYGRLQSPGDPASADLGGVLERLDRLSEVRQRLGTVKPILIPEMTKTRDNVHELDEFHDGWLRRCGAVCISGASHNARQCEDRSVINMAPPTRVACRRLRSRCLVLADGRVAVCDQDFNGLHTLGRIGEQSLGQIWRGTEFTRIREAHNRAGVPPPSEVGEPMSGPVRKSTCPSWPPGDQSSSPPGPQDLGHPPHKESGFDAMPLCAACDEWHRP